MTVEIDLFNGWDAACGGSGRFIYLYHRVPRSSIALYEAFLFAILARYRPDTVMGRRRVWPRRSRLTARSYLTPNEDRNSLYLAGKGNAFATTTTSFAAVGNSSVNMSRWKRSAAMRSQRSGRLVASQPPARVCRTAAGPSLVLRTGRSLTCPLRFVLDVHQGNPLTSRPDPRKTLRVFSYCDRLGMDSWRRGEFNITSGRRSVTSTDQISLARVFAVYPDVGFRWLVHSTSLDFVEPFTRPRSYPRHL